MIGYEGIVDSNLDLWCGRLRENQGMDGKENSHERNGS